MPRRRLLVQPTPRSLRARTADGAVRYGHHGVEMHEQTEERTKSSQSTSDGGRDSYSPKTLVDHLKDGGACSYNIDSCSPSRSRRNFQNTPAICSPERRRTITERPAMSYTTLITEALESSPRGRMLLSDIYTKITDRYPYYRVADPGWKNSVRHALSASPCFVSIALSGSASPGCTPGSRRRYEWALRGRAMSMHRGRPFVAHANTERGNDSGPGNGASSDSWPPTPDTWTFANVPGVPSMLRPTSADPFLPSPIARASHTRTCHETRTIGIEADASCAALEFITSGFQFSPPCHLSDL